MVGPASVENEKRLQKLEFHPLTPERWDDFETLFGKRGACGGCWCMWWRLLRSDFELQKGEVNRRAMKKIVGSGEVRAFLPMTRGKQSDGVPWHHGSTFHFGTLEDIETD